MPPADWVQGHWPNGVGVIQQAICLLGGLLPVHETPLSVPQSVTKTFKADLATGIS